jgi:hypothetical protein
MEFENVPIGARFTFTGREHVKKALNLGDDENSIRHVFMYETDVESEAKGDESNSGMAGKWIKREPLKKMMPLGLLSA